jgi:hypothetical protein
MTDKPSFPSDRTSRYCIQDPGFLDDPHAVWAAVMFIALADRTAGAVESVQRYAGMIQTKKTVSSSLRPGHPVPLYLQ